MSLSSIGIYLGLILGIAGGLGFAGGGYVADRVGRRSTRYSFHVIVVALLLAWILYFPIFFASGAGVLLADVSIAATVATGKSPQCVYTHPHSIE